MCDATVYRQNGQGWIPYFEHLDTLIVEGDNVRIVNLFGKSETLHSKVKRFSLLDHKVIVESMDSRDTSK
jgi:predicted RNA-binding protein